MRHWVDFTPEQLLAHVEEMVSTTGNNIYQTTQGLKEAVWRTLICNITHTGDEAEPSYGRYFDAYMEYTSSPALTTDTNTLSMATQFGRTVDSTSCGRPIGITKQGYVCSLQNGMQHGDVVAVLRGGRVPHVLRPTGDGKYHLLGEAYVQGLMKGEALLLSDLSEEIRLV